jgi:GT2 family glycosyltransferase
VVVVNWNDLQSSLRCLGSIRAAGPDALLVLVDNASDSDPSGPVGRAFPEAEVVRLETNRGYAGGCNAGAERALARGAEHVLFLNNDAFIDEGTIPALLEAERVHPDAILGPKIVYSEQPETVWSAGGEVSGPLLRNRHIGEGEPARDHQVDRRVRWTTGCALFVSASCFRRIGPLDERYFLYLEDTDWCLRAAELGVETWFVAGAVVRHEVSRTLRSPALSSYVRYYAYRNQYQLAIRRSAVGWWPLVVADAVWTLVKAGIRSALSPGYRGDSYYHARTRGVRDFLLGRSGPMPVAAAPAGRVPEAVTGR